MVEANTLELLGRVAVALERIAAYLDTPPKTNPQLAEHIELLRRSVEQRTAWEATEREHMKVCERKFHERVRQESDNAVVN